MQITEEKLTKMKDILDDLKDKNSKAIAQEELLLKQLKEEFDVDNTDEGYDLYEQLVSEKNDAEKKVALDTDSLYDSLVNEGLITTK